MIGKYLISRHDRAGLIFLAIVGLAAVLIPLSNVLLPESSPLHVPTYVVALLGKYLCYATLAVALDLVWGYCGILSLGHGAFFALGGYAMGMYLMRQIGSRGVYAHPILPDFMVFLNWKELPWFWHGFDIFPFAFVMMLFVPGLLAFVFGWLAFRSRVTGVYLSIITQALTYALMLAFFRNDMGFGGNNGLTDFKDIVGFSLQSSGTRATLFFLSASLLIAVYLISRWIVHTSYGKVLVAVRDGEARARFLGYRTEHFKLFVFVVVGHDDGTGGRAVRSAGRHHQPVRIRSRQFHRGGRLGRGRRPRHPGRRGARRGCGEFPENGLHHRRACALLALCSRRALRSCHTRHAKRHSRRLERIVGQAAQTRSGSQRIAATGGMNMTEEALQTTQAILYLDGVSVSFDGFKAISNLSLYLAPGEMRAVIGPNGAGKTTLMDIITGKTRPDEGEVLFDHGRYDLTQLDETAIANLGVGRKFQKPTVFESHTVADNILLALKGPRGPFACLYGWRNNVPADRIEAILNATGLLGHRDRTAGEISHGQKQWLEIGMLLAQDPAVLLVDEPVAGMTDAETAQTAQLLKNIAGNHAVVVVEHDMDFVRALDCKVTCLHEGSVLAEGTIEAVANDERVIEVYLGR